MIASTSLDRIVRRLESRVRLDSEDRAAIHALPAQQRTIEPAGYMVREGEKVEHCVLLLAGFAYRHKVTGAGQRQIVSIHMPGEFLDLQNSQFGIADHNVQALTRCEVATVPVAALTRLAEDRPRVGRAMWIDTLVDAAIFREWIVNVGRRDAITRLAHLLCEIALRLEEAGLAVERRYQLPMTQEHLADCTGLTAVHVNRALQELGRLGLIVRDKRSVEILDWDQLQRIGDFNTGYLHFDAGGPTNLQSAL